MSMVVDLSPIVKSVEVRRSAKDAFRIFTEEVSAWWPMKTHNRGLSAKGEITASVTIEPRVGGRVYETLTDGRELEWGEVTVFEPGALFAMDWRLGRPVATYVSVAFEPIDAQRTRVTLTHDKWERLAREDQEKSRSAHEGGWAVVFEQCFLAYANRG